MDLTREMAISIVVYRTCRYCRNFHGAKHAHTKPVFQRKREELGLGKGVTAALSPKCRMEDVYKVLSKKEVAEIKAATKAEVLLSK